MWRPEWYTTEHVSGWERTKEALRRDWEQTKKDLHAGGHEMNQSVSDTLNQASGTQPLPPSDKPNPPRIIGEWSEAEMPAGYGYSARSYYGAQHPAWGPELEEKLRAEWNAAQGASLPDWNEVRPHVRYGYDYKPRP
jgi:hypothetical protein